MSSATDQYVPWEVSGTYFESCNCDAICPCRRIGGRAGGRSTHGVCEFALSWQIEDGSAGATDLTGLAAVIAGWYDDDEPGSPWRFALYVDERGDDEQRRALAEILLGRLGGERVLGLPWVRKPSELLELRPSRIEIDHTPRRQWFRVEDVVTVRVRGPVETEETVTCVIPGHDQVGEELYVDVLEVEAGPLSWHYEGTCSYAAPFSYRSGEGDATS